MKIALTGAVLAFLLPSLAFAMTPATVVQLVNADRIANHLPPLKEVKLLDGTAQARASHLASTQTFTHDGWMFELTFPYHSAGENLAMRFTTEASQELAFMNSPTHRANILSTKYTEIGVGIATSSTGDIYVAQEFLRP